MPPTADPRAQEPSHRILIVEDDYLVALQFENALTEAGFDVVDIASTAEEAIQLVSDHRAELVLMDVRLRGTAFRRQRRFSTGSACAAFSSRRSPMPRRVRAPIAPIRSPGW